MRRFSSLLLVVGCLVANLIAQQKSARTYYEEAREAGGLPELPYVCFRNTMETSVNLGKEGTWDEPTFAMIGTSKQIADIIKRKAYASMSDADRKRLAVLQSNDFLYMQPFSHGVASGEHIFDLANPSDQSRANWTFEGTIGEKKTPLKWDFNINWGTLRFREKLSQSEGYLIFYGQCELVSR